MSAKVSTISLTCCQTQDMRQQPLTWSRGLYERKWWTPTSAIKAASIRTGFTEDEAWISTALECVILITAGEPVHEMNVIVEALSDTMAVHAECRDGTCETLQVISQINEHQGLCFSLRRTAHGCRVTHHGRRSITTQPSDSRCHCSGVLWGWPVKCQGCLGRRR